LLASPVPLTLSQSPKLSALAVHPSGATSRAPTANVHVTFGPETPLYADIATAAGGAWGKRVTKYAELKSAMAEAVRVVREEKRCAVLDVVLKTI
jgi:hypothetical protein